MGIHITINTDELTALDRQVLAVLAGNAAPAEPRTAQSEEKPKAPAKKAAPKPKPEPEPEPEDEDVLGDEGPTMKDAVARATELVSAQRATEVKAALSNLGVKKVSELKGAQIGEFLTALED